MGSRIAAATLIWVMASGTGFAQQKTAAKGAVYDVTIQADGAAYTGTMELTVVAGKVTGAMNITQPTEITGKAAGASKAGQMKLNFPYRMVQRACDGQIAMDIKMPATAAAGPATGTVSISGCGRPESNPLPGTIELKPQVKPKK